MLTGPLAARTLETSSSVEASVEKNFLQEVDLTFWQTLPFAALWCFVVERQLSGIMYPGEAARWEAIITFAAVTSLGNALFSAGRVMAEHHGPGGADQ